MTRKKSKDAAIDELEQGGWLYELLVEARKSVAKQPTAAAIKRMQARLFAQMEEREERAAA